MPPKVLVTGANGMLGQNAIRVLQDAELTVHGTDLQPEPLLNHPDTYTPLDLVDHEALMTLVNEFEPQWIVHTAAYTDVDGAEENPAVAFRINSEVVGTIVECCQQQGIKLIHISTDYVFSGTDGPYDEDDVPDPAGVYARSKFSGEELVRDSSIHWNVVRSNVLYGHGQELKSSFVTWLLTELKQARDVRIVNDQYNNPSYARRLAEVCRIIIDQNQHGIWHFGSREVISRLDFARKVADVFGLPPGLIHPISTSELSQRAPRPMLSGLVCNKVSTALNYPILSVTEELQMLKEELNGA